MSCCFNLKSFHVILNEITNIKSIIIQIELLASNNSDQLFIWFESYRIEVKLWWFLNFIIIKTVRYKVLIILINYDRLVFTPLFNFFITLTVSTCLIVALLITNLDILCLKSLGISMNTKLFCVNAFHLRDFISHLFRVFWRIEQYFPFLIVFIVVTKL